MEIDNLITVLVSMLFGAFCAWLFLKKATPKPPMKGEVTEKKTINRKLK